MFSAPAQTSGQPKGVAVKAHPASAGESAAARLRGTAVTLAAAGRSAGSTTAMTYDERVGTSISDNRLRNTRQATASGNVGAHAARIRKTLDGRCVNTIVLTKPKRAASRAVTKYENAAHRPVTKKITPAVPGERPKRWNSHSASSAFTTKPPPKASTENKAASP